MPNLEKSMSYILEFQYAKSCWGYTIIPTSSPRNSLRQSITVEDFAEANSVFIVITSAKILLMWLLCSKIYIQFTIFNTYFLTKLLFTNKRYHLHVLEKCMYVLQEVRSMIYFQQFIHPLSLHWYGNGTSFAFRSYIIIVTLSKSYLYKFFFLSFFSVYWASFFHICLYFWTQIKHPKLFLKQFLIWEKSTLHCTYITIFV